MAAFKVSLMFMAFMFAGAFGTGLAYRLPLVRNAIVSIVAVVVMAFVAGIPQDAASSWRGTHAGDRWRLFLYNQTARHSGVPVALEKYGIDPQ